MADYTRLGNLPTKFKQSDMLQPDSYEMGSLCGSSDTDDPRIEHEGIAPTTDDPSTPSLTFRVYFLGTVWCVALGAVNSVFAFRTSPFAVPAFLATLLSYPMGLFMAATLPRKVAGSTFLNPGRFSAKEHVLITIIASAGASVAYGIDNVGHESITYWEALSWVLVTQFVGFGISGLARRFLIKPSSMVWPNILSSVALFVSFHSAKQTTGPSRFTYFCIAFLGCFLYSWLPQYFAVVMQSFSFLCFSSNRSLNFLASSSNGYGIGLGALTLDWYHIGGDTLTTPWWAAVNIGVANFLWGWVLTPLAYFSNAFGADQILTKDKYPDNSFIGSLNTASIFNRTGHAISPVNLYSKPSFNLNATIYDSQQPIYITSMFAMAYASSFLSIVAAFVHVWLWHGQDIYRRFQAALHQIEDKDDNGDIHNVLMRAYPDVSESFFLGFLFVLVLFQISISFTTPFHMPVWAILLCLFMSLLSVLPIGIITAVSGQRLGLNVLTEFVIGLLMPGETIPVMAFKSLGTNSVSQAIMLLQDLKLGHYMKINPRHMIAAQLYGSLIGAIINTSCCFWVLDNMKSLLGTGDWQATSFFVFYNAGAIWGAIGPKRFFGIGSVYESLLYAFALGLILPFIPYLLNKTYPHTLWKYVHVPLLSSFDGPGRYQNRVIIPLLVAWYFQYYRARYHPIWWQKYNYVLAVALDAGVGVCALLAGIFGELGILAPIHALNPDIRSVPLDYYCFGKPFK